MNSTEKNWKGWKVTGKVQGVSFRAASKKAALEIGIQTGWVRNLVDGSVELWANGTEDQHAKLSHWCELGPGFASVDQVVLLPKRGGEINCRTEEGRFFIHRDGCCDGYSDGSSA